MLGPPHQQEKAGGRAGLATGQRLGLCECCLHPVPPQPPPSPRGSVLGALRLPALPSAELVSPEGPQQQ